MRKALPFLVLLVSLGLSACEDTPTTTSTVSHVGKMSMGAFRAEPAYAIWFDVAYNSYPGSSADVQARFNAATQSIRANFDPAHHSVMMVVKPECSCALTKQMMPSVVKTLDAAGIPAENVTIYVTNSRMEGFDEVKSTHMPMITGAPTFIVMKDNVEKGRITEAPVGTSVEEQLAGFFRIP